jgi:hypothetical protein
LHRRIEFQPGTYEILIEFYPGELMEAILTERFEISLLPDHRYRPRTRSCPWTERFGCSILLSMVYVGDGIAGLVWVEDITSGQIVAGSKTVPDRVK